MSSSPSRLVPTIVHARFRESGLNIKLDWIKATIAGEKMKVSTEKELWSRMLGEDLRLIGDPILPSHIGSVEKKVLDGPFVLQICDLVNVAEPLLQKAPSTSPSPSSFPSPSRKMMKIKLTDGHTTAIALEYGVINHLYPSTPIGTKIVVKGVLIRRGMMLLVPENTLVLGGSVEFSVMSADPIRENIPPSAYEELDGDLPIITYSSMPYTPSVIKREIPGQDTDDPTLIGEEDDSIWFQISNNREEAETQTILDGYEEMDCKDWASDSEKLSSVVRNQHTMDLSSRSNPPSFGLSQALKKEVITISPPFTHLSQIDLGPPSGSFLVRAALSCVESFDVKGDSYSLTGKIEDGTCCRPVMFSSSSAKEILGVDPKDFPAEATAELESKLARLYCLLTIEKTPPFQELLVTKVDLDHSKQKTREMARYYLSEL